MRDASLLRLISPFFAALTAVAALSTAPLREARAGSADQDAFQAALEQHLTTLGLRTSPSFNKSVAEGVLELGKGKWIVAAQHFGAAYDEAREHPLPPLLIGLACVGMKQFDKASEFLRYATLKWPGLAAARPPLELWLGGAEQHGRLIKDLEDELYSRKPGTAEASTALYLAGFFHAFGGEHDKAVKYLLAVPEGARELAAARITAKSVRARVAPPARKRGDRAEEAGRLAAEGRYSEAAHAFGAAVIESPEDPVCWFEMGHALFACGYFRHAARVLAVGLDLKRDWVGADLDLESLYPENRRGDYAEHLKSLQGWVSAHPDDGASRFLLGYVLYFSKDRSSCAAQLEAASSLGWKRQADFFLKALWGRSQGAAPGGAAQLPEGPAPAPEDPVEPPPPEPEPEPIAEGLALLASGDAENAYRRFSAAFAERELQGRAMIGFACVDLARGENAEAARWLREAFRSAREAFFSDEFSKALKTSELLSKRIDELVGRSAAIDAERAARRSSAGDRDPNPEKDREDRDAWLLAGFCLMQTGRIEEALARFNELNLEFEGAEAAAIEAYVRLSSRLPRRYD